MKYLKSDEPVNSKQSEVLKSINDVKLMNEDHIIWKKCLKFK